MEKDYSNEFISQIIAKEKRYERYILKKISKKVKKLRRKIDVKKY